MLLDIILQEMAEAGIDGRSPGSPFDDRLSLSIRNALTDETYLQFVLECAAVELPALGFPKLTPAFRETRDPF